MRELIRQKIVDSLSAPLPRLTPRDVHVPRVKDRCVAVIGPRRAGKTTFLWQLLSERAARGAPREGLLYFSFEDERLADMRAKDLHVVIEEYYALQPEWRDRRRATLFLDEIQIVKGWETFVRRVLDTENVDLFVSGSSASLLSREVATSMRGRAVEALVYPFSLREYLRHLGREPTRPPTRLPKAERSALDKALRDYLTNGGFPETIGLARRDRYAVLRGLVDVVLLRDVIERHAVSHPVALRAMVRHLLANAGGLFSVNKFYNDLRSQGLHVAKDTLHAYLAHLEDAYLVRTVPVAAASERRRMVNPRKAYPVDPGLTPVFDRTGRANLGHALETCVLLALERRGADVTYVRTEGGLEVDFLARFPEGQEALIQVCADTEGPAFERETRALQEAHHEHPRASLELITMHATGAEPPAGITSHRAVDWLLSQQR